MASCPAGKRLMGGGGEIFIGTGQVRFDEIRPNAALTSITVHAVEDENGYAQPWSVTAYAICSSPPFGLQLVSATSASNSSGKGVQAKCPGGKQVLGTV